MAFKKQCNSCNEWSYSACRSNLKKCSNCGESIEDSKYYPSEYRIKDKRGLCNNYLNISVEEANKMSTALTD